MTASASFQFCYPESSLFTRRDSDGESSDSLEITQEIGDNRNVGVTLPNIPKSKAAACQRHPVPSD